MDWIIKLELRVVFKSKIEWDGVVYTTVNQWRWWVWVSPFLLRFEPFFKFELVRFEITWIWFEEWLSPSLLLSMFFIVFHLYEAIFLHNSPATALITIPLLTLVVSLSRCLGFKWVSQTRVWPYNMSKEHISQILSTFILVTM